MMRMSFGFARRFVIGLTLIMQMLFVGLMWDSMRVNTNWALYPRACTSRNMLSMESGNLRDDESSQTMMNFLSDEELLIHECQIRPNTRVDCKALCMGGTEAIRAAENTSYEKMISGNCSVINLVDNCKVLIKAHHYKTDRNILSKEELDYPLAFALKMHKDPDQAEQLLRLIYRPHNVYCIYIDKKASGKVFDVFKKLSACFHNVFVIEERIDVIYASLSHVLAEMQCMHELLSRAVLWKYYINLTGQELPLRTNIEIVKILKALQGTNDIESFIFPKYLKFRVEKKFNVQKGSLREEKNSTKDQFMYNITLRKGSAYGMFRREFIEFLHEDNIAQTFLRWLNDSRSPEETIWATLNGLPWAPGGYPMETSHKSRTFLSRATIWQWDPPRCEGRFTRSVCIYGLGNLPWLASRPQIIANKFDRTFDPIAPDCLEELIRNRTDNPAFGFEQMDWYFYRNLPHVLYYANLTKEQKSMSYLSKKKSSWEKHHQLVYLNRIRKHA